MPFHMLLKRHFSDRDILDIESEIKPKFDQVRLVRHKIVYQNSIDHTEMEVSPYTKMNMLS